MARRPNKIPDAALIDAEVAIADGLRKLDRLPEGDGHLALAAAIDRLDRFVATRRPKTLTGAAVKLRRLLDPDTGIAVGRSALDVVSIAQVLALLHRLAGAPGHRTRPSLRRPPAGRCGLRSAEHPVHRFPVARREQG
jgi:hypothetical protein